LFAIRKRADGRYAENHGKGQYHRQDFCEWSFGCHCVFPPLFYAFTKDFIFKRVYRAWVSFSRFFRVRGNTRLFAQANEEMPANEKSPETSKFRGHSFKHKKITRIKVFIRACLMFCPLQY
jgi:hypothetical protein